MKIVNLLESTRPIQSDIRNQLLAEDCERIESVLKILGPGQQLAVDANGRLAGFLDRLHHRRARPQHAGQLQLIGRLVLGPRDGNRSARVASHVGMRGLGKHACQSRHELHRGRVGQGHRLLRKGAAQASICQALAIVGPVVRWPRRQQ